MKTIKEITFTIATLFAAIITTLSATSCTSAETRRDIIKTADSISNVNPKAAIAFIDSVTANGNKISISVRMKFALIKVKAQNKLFLPLNNDTLKMLEKYYDNHGTDNDRMLMKYIIACSFLDKNDAPMALQYFHKAASQAKPADKDCDYLTLHKIHTQTAMLLHAQNANNEALNENALAHQYALKAKDTLDALISTEQNANIYGAMGKTDSVIAIRKRLYELYNKINKPDYAVRALGPIIDEFAKQGKIVTAKKYIDIYEKQSGTFDNNGNIEKGREIYYSIKACYYIAINKLDSAEILLRKCCATTNNFEYLDYTYDKLAQLYKKTNKTDSVAKYMELSKNMKDSAYNQMSTKQLQQMEAMYNYSYYKDKAKQEHTDNVKTKNTIIIIAPITFVILCVSTYLIINTHKKRKRDLMQYKKNIANIESAKEELNTLIENRQKEMQQLIDKKTNEIMALQQKLLQYEKKKLTRNQSKKSAYLMNAEITRQLKQHVKKDFCPMTNAECDKLKELFRNYKSLSKWENSLKGYEYEICLLIKLEFTPSEISILTQRTLSDISNIRKRLLLKMTGETDSSRKFDKFIKDL